MSALTFEEAWRDSIPGTTGDGIPVRHISRDHLILNKTVDGRLQDLADVAALQAAIRANIPPED